MELTLNVKNLWFSYDNGDPILKDVSFQLNGGDVCLLLGKNASGKSTLLKCLNRVHIPQNGEILVDGKAIEKLSRPSIAKIFAYVPQEHTVMFPFSCVEIVLMGRNPHLNLFQQPNEQDYVQAEQALEKVGMGHLKDKKYTELSGGQRQLVLIARAIAQSPKIMLMDEPTSHLDIKNRYLILEDLLHEFQKKGIICILAVHNPDEALNLSNKVAMLHNGEIVAFGEHDKILTKENLTNVFEIELELHPIKGGKEKVLCRAS
jgi:iron complex transport system ATP-binding protein